MKAGWYSWLLAGLLAALPAHAAQDLAPDALAKSITADVLAELRAGSKTQAGDSLEVQALIEAKILPHFDFADMTRLAMGKNWAQATPGQRMALTGEFRTLLLRTYTAPLMQYRDQVIDYRPLKLAPEDTDVVVKSVIRQAGGEPISVDYSMKKTDGGWKVYDVKFAGMSLVMNYRSTFTAEIQRSGMEGLIKALAEKNRALAGKSRLSVRT